MDKKLLDVREALRDADSNLISATARYLAGRGWEYSCENPSSIWLWIKTIDGVRFAVSPGVAIDFQDELDAREEDRG